MSDYPMLISNKLHSFRNFSKQMYMISAAVARIEYFFSGFVFSFLKDFITFADVFRIKGNETCGNSSVGRASASQAEGHEFEPRLPLS